MKKEIIIDVEFFGNPDIPEEVRYVGWIKGKEYKGNIVSGSSIGECVKELGISLIVLEEYKKLHQ